MAYSPHTRNSQRVRALLGAIALAAVCLQTHPLFAAEPPDPADALKPSTLSPDDEKLARAWFKELGSDDFDTRERALAKLTAKGPPVLPLAQEFFNDPDKDLAASAKGLRLKILLNYDGYMPVDPELSKALKAPLNAKIDWIRSDGRQLDYFATIKKFCETHALRYELDPGVDLKAVRTYEEFVGANLAPITSTVETALLFMQFFGGIAGLPRGDVYLFTTVSAAKQLRIQRRTFDWSNLELNQDEAQRAEQELEAFISDPAAEIHSGSNALVLRGEEQYLRRVARLIALLDPKTPDAIWPATPGKTDAALLKSLSEPAQVHFSNEALPAMLTELQKFHPGAKLVKLPVDTDILQRLQGGDTWNVQLESLHLNLPQAGLPAGMIFRWIERRAKLTDETHTTMLAYDIDPASGDAFFQPRPRALQLDRPVAGGDVAFLYKQPAEFSKASDAAVRKRLLETLDTHLALFPALNPNADFRVFRGRLLMQSPAVTLSRVLALIREWRESGRPPQPAQWKLDLDQKLDTGVDWDGRELTAGRLISTLRELGKINILIEEASDTVREVQLKKSDAELLPPGKHTLRELLDELAKRANIVWQIDSGVIVLAGKPETK